MHARPRKLAITATGVLLALALSPVVGNPAHADSGPATTSVSDSPVSTDGSAQTVETAVPADCGAGTHLVAPAQPGDPLDPAAVGLPTSPLVEAANAAGATWITSLDCTQEPSRSNAAAGIASTSAGPTSSTSDYTSHNWSGYYATGGGGGTPDYVYGTWTVPNVTWTRGGTNYSCIWTGLGGWGGNKHLVQAGTEQNQAQGQSQVNYMWWEVLPASQTRIDNITVHNQDVVQTNVSYDSTYGQALMAWWDKTTNQSSYVVVNTTAPGLTAEWIVERTEINGNYPVLADFGDAVTFTDAQYETTNGLLHDPDHDGYRIDMNDINGTQLVHTAATTSDRVHVGWKYGGVVSPAE